MNAETSFLYDSQGKSRFLSSPIITSHPLSSDHGISPLYLGSLSDLVLIDNPAKSGLFGKHCKEKTLENYIRLTREPSEMPVYIVDHHEAVLYCWYEALAEGRIDLGSSLIHYDDHSDTGIPSKRAPVITKDELQNGTWSLNDAVEQVKKLGCWEFIEPAMQSGLIDKFLYITPARTDYEQHYSKSDHHAEHTEMSIEHYSKNDYGKHLQNKIVDIDLDFFASKKLNFERQEQCIQKMRQDIATADVATFATSPGFIDQERAIELVKTILK